MTRYGYVAAVMVSVFGMTATVRNKPTHGACAQEKKADPAPVIGKKNAVSLPPGATAMYGEPLRRHGKEIGSLSISPNGKTLLSTTSQPKVQSLKLWSLPEGKLLRTFELADDQFYARFIDDDRVLLVGRTKSLLRVMSMSTGGIADCSREVPQDAKLRDFAPAVSAGGERTAVADVNGAIHVFGLKDVSLLQTLKTRPGLKFEWQGLNISADGRTVAAFDTDNLVIWDVGTGKRIRTQNERSAEHETVCFHPDGKSMAVSTHQNLVVWDVETETESARSEIGDDRPIWTGYSGDGKRLILVGIRGSIRHWEPQTGKPMEQLTGCRGTRRTVAVAMSKDGTLLVQGDDDGMMTIYETATGKELGSEKQAMDLTEPSFTADGKGVVVVDLNSGIRRWNVADGSQLSVVELPEKGARIIAYSDDHRWATVASDDHPRIRMVDLKTSKVIWEKAEHNKFVTSLRFSPDGRHVVSVGDDDATIVMSATDGRVTHRFESKEDTLVDCRFSKDGRFMGLCLHENNAVSIVEFETGLERWNFKLNKPSDFRFSPDGRQVALIGEYRFLRVIDLRTEKAVFSAVFDDEIDSVAWSDDGRRFAVGHAGGRVSIYSETFHERLSFTAHDAEVRGMAFHPDGKRMVTAGADGTSVLWDFDLIRRHQTRTSPVATRPTERLWDDLKGTNSAIVRSAMRELADRPLESINLMQRELTTEKKTDRKTLDALSADLESNRFETRSKAQQRLIELGEGNSAVLRERWKLAADNDLRLRLETVLKKLDGPETNPERIRRMRAIELLQTIGSAEGDKLLERMAAGDPDSRVTRSAVSALANRKLFPAVPPKHQSKTGP